MHPKISVCIPVYNSEKTLPGTLDSLLQQNFDSFEVIVVNDSSSDRDSFNRNCSQIVSDFKKSVKKNKKHISISIVHHDKNKGLVEARRSAVYTAKAPYILFVDSDDTLPVDSLSSLFKKIVETGADIVHGKAEIISQIKNPAKEELVQLVASTEMFGKDILDGFLIKQNHNGFLWGKLFNKEVCLEAFNLIPPVYCVLAEDFLIYVWISRFSKKYASFDKIVYNYNLSNGITSKTIIDDPSRWEKACSASTIFTMLLSSDDYYSPEQYFTEDQINAIKRNALLFVQNNLKQLEKAVSPTLKEKAREIMNEYWGEDLVQTVESAIK